MKREGEPPPSTAFWSASRFSRFRYRTGQPVQEGDEEEERHESIEDDQKHAGGICSGLPQKIDPCEISDRRNRWDRQQEFDCHLFPEFQLGLKQACQIAVQEEKANRDESDACPVHL